MSLLQSGAKLRPLLDSDGRELEKLCELCAAFTEEVTGLPPGPAEAQSIFAGLPPDGDYCDKRLWGLFKGEYLCGVVDAAFNHPRAGHFWIALFMLAPDVRRRRLGSAVLNFMRAYAQEHGAHTLSLAVKSDYALAQSFWRAKGFQKVGQSELVMAGHGPTLFDVMDLAIL